MAMIQPTVSALRDGTVQDIPTDQIVPGDIVSLSAGKNIPSDCILTEAKDLFVTEATLTGEPYPIEKRLGTTPSDAGLSQRTNMLFMGTNVVSGSGNALVVKTGKATEFGKISEHLRLRPPETEFEHVTHTFGFFLMQITLVLTIFIFIANAIIPGKNITLINTFMFALSLAVGMTPQLLPAIITITLTSGAKKMAQKKVIVKRLNSIENFGSLNILCSDKTGTLTEGIMKLQSAVDIDGNNSDRVFLFAYLNAYFQSGFNNPIDDAIKERSVDISSFTKLDEVPYDFLRKRLSILVEQEGKNTLVCKGDLKKVLEVCKR